MRAPNGHSHRFRCEVACWLRRVVASAVVAASAGVAASAQVVASAVVPASAVVAIEAASARLSEEGLAPSGRSAQESPQHEAVRGRRGQYMEIRLAAAVAAADWLAAVAEKAPALALPTT